MTENENPQWGRGKIYAVIAVVVMVTVISGGAFLAYTLSSNHSNQFVTQSPHLTVSNVSVQSHTYTDVILQITLGNTTTITGYDVWCESSPYTSSVNWLFSNGVSKIVDVHSDATPSNNYADFGGTYGGQTYSPMNPYHLTLHNSEGIQVTVDFSIP